MGADGEGANLALHAQNLRRGDRAAAQGVGQVQAQVQELAEGRGQIEDRTVEVVGVQVAANGAWDQVLRQRGLRHAPGEAALAVSHVEMDAAIDRVADRGAHAAVVVEDALIQPVIAVGEQVAGLHLAEDVVKGADGRVGVDHDRQPHGIRRLAGAVQRRQRVVSRQVFADPGLDADDHVAVALADLDGSLGVDEPDVLELTHNRRDHARRGDVEAGLEARFGDLDHVAPQTLEGVGAGRSGVDGRGDAAGQDIGVGVDAVVADAVVDVHVDVDEAGR